MKIAVCENDKTIADNLAQRVEKCFFELNSDADVDVYYTGKDFELCGIIYDLLFLDCKLDDINGIDVARNLRSRECETVIIFTTAYEEYVYESFEVNAFRYLLKPIKDDALKKAITSFLSACKDESHLIISKGKKMLSTRLDRVMYIEACEKHSIVRSLDGVYESTKSISDYQEEINSYAFFRTHRRFLVNMKYIIEVDNNIITLTNGEKVEVSRRNLTTFNKCYMNYLKYSV